MSGRRRATTLQPDVGVSRRVRRQPGGETEQRWCDVVMTQGRAVCTHGMRLGGSHRRLWNRRMSPVGATAQVLRGKSAQTSHHMYLGRSTREVHRVRCQAAAGGPRHPSNRNSSRHRSSRASFFGSWTTLTDLIWTESGQPMSRVAHLLRRDRVICSVRVTQRP
jgi:hypothetical protein